MVVGILLICVPGRRNVSKRLVQAMARFWWFGHIFLIIKHRMVSDLVCAHGVLICSLFYGSTYCNFLMQGWGGSRLELRNLVFPTRLLSYGIIIYLFGQPPNKSNSIKQPLMYYKIEFHWFDLPIKAMNFQALQFHS